ncbi:MAG: hypothetical protein AAGL69_07830 [Pseudomonadota bacterium]
MTGFLSYLPQHLSDDELCVVDPDEAMLSQLDDDARVTCTRSDDTPHPRSRELTVLFRQHHGALLACDQLDTPSPEWAAIVTPVTQTADLRDVRISALPKLPNEEAEALVDALNALLENDPSNTLRRLRVRFSPSEGNWFLVGNGSQGPRFDADVPSQLLGQPLRDHPIRGPDAALIKRWMTEIQMTLHGAEWNQRRAQEGQPPVNAIWLHGAGARPEAVTAQLPALQSQWVILRALWKHVSASIEPGDRLQGCVLCGRELHSAALDLLLRKEVRHVVLLTNSKRLVVRRARWHHRLRRFARGRL